MTLVDLDLLFNYDVRHSGDGERFAGIKDKKVQTDAVYVDYYSDDSVLLGVEHEDASISIEIPSEKIPVLIEELEDHA